MPDNRGFIMKAKIQGALGIGFGVAVGSVLYQAYHAGFADVDPVRALFTGTFVGLFWLLVSLWISGRGDPGTSAASTDRDVRRR